MKTIFLFLAAAITLTAEARITDGQVKTKIADNKIELTLNSGFHFNQESPVSAKFDERSEAVKPSAKTEQQLVFTAPAGSKKVKLSYYVCDDKKTACEQHQGEVGISGDKNVGALKANPVSEKPQLANMAKPEPHSKPKLLLFSAPWCPACLRMQTETYNQKNVEVELQKLDTQKINIDLPENSEIADSYHVKAIPTIILLNKEGEEISRWLDYQSANLFASELRDSLKTSVSLETLRKKASAGDKKSVSRLGMQAYNSMDCAEAILWFSKSKSVVDKNYLLASEIACAEEKPQDDEKNKDAYLGTLQKSSEKTSSPIDRIRWQADLLEKMKENKSGPEFLAKKAEVTLAEIDSLLKKPAQLDSLFKQSTFGDAGGYEVEELNLMRVKLYDIMDRAEKKKAAQNQIAALIAKRKLSVARSGEMLLAIAYLKEAEEKQNVEKLYQELLEKFPNTYVYHDKHAKYLLTQKNYEKALVESNIALKFPEGNEPQLLLSKAKILKEMKNKTEALSVLTAMQKLDNINHKKYKKVVAQAENLKKELATDRARD